MMEISLDGPSRVISFNPNAEVLPPGNERDLSPGGVMLIRAAEAIGGTLGKIVHGGRTVYAKFGMGHNADTGGIEDVAGELQAKGAAITDAFSEISENVMNYVRTHSAKDIGHDLDRAAKRYPIQSLALAAAAGFLLERSLQKRRC